MSKIPEPIAERAADFLVGLSFPQRLPGTSGPFKQPAADFPRISIADAIDVTPWPGRSNDYLPNGYLKNANRAAYGQNFLVGAALGHDLVRAFLLGLLCDLPSSDDKRRRLYQTACALADGDLQRLQQDASALRTLIASLNVSITNITNAIALPRAVIDTDGQPGDVVRWNASDHLEIATGPDLADQETVVGLLGEPCSAGQECQWYPTGTTTPPVSGRSLGRVYRARDAGARNQAALTPDDYSIHVGVVRADGRIDVQIDCQDFVVVAP